MKARRWTTPEMVDLSHKLVDIEHEFGGAMTRIPELAGMIPRLTKVHIQLMDTHGTTLVSLLAPIITAQTEVGAEHDNWNRALYYLLQGHIYRAKAMGDADLALALIKIRDLLLPNGLEVITYSYRAEAGQAEILASRLTPKVEKALAQIPVAKDCNLAHVAHRIVGAGRVLGLLEDKRTELRNKKSAGITAGRARMQWVEVMGVLFKLLKMNRGEDEGVDKILEVIADIDRKAELRIKARKSGAANADSAPEPRTQPDTEPEAAPELNTEFEPDGALELKAAPELNTEFEPDGALEPEAAPELNTEFEPDGALELDGALQPAAAPEPTTAFKPVGALEPEAVPEPTTAFEPVGALQPAAVPEM